MKELEQTSRSHTFNLTKKSLCKFQTMLKWNTFKELLPLKFTELWCQTVIFDYPKAIISITWKWLYECIIKRLKNNRIKTVFNYLHWQKAQKQLIKMKMLLNCWLSEVKPIHQNKQQKKQTQLWRLFFFSPQKNYVNFSKQIFLKELKLCTMLTVFNWIKQFNVMQTEKN